jgi:serine/threonine protein kinase
MNDIYERKKQIDKYEVSGYIPEKAPKYAITKKLLGGGAFGAVWLSYNKDSPDKTYAIKVIVNKSANHLENLINEVYVLKQLSSAPNCNRNISCIYDYFQENNTLFVVMEYIDGLELLEYVEKSLDKNIPIKDIMTENILLQCVIGMNSFHRDGIIHRDIKPQNIMITNNGIIKYVDFGTGCSVIPKSLINSCKGTPGSVGYLDPLFYLNKISTACKTSDIYSLGATFFKLMFTDTSLPIYMGMTEQQALAVYDQIQDIIEGSNFSEKLKKIVTSMISPLDNRPSSMDIIAYIENGLYLSKKGYNKDECRYRTEEKNEEEKEEQDEKTLKNIEYIKQEALKGKYNDYKKQKSLLTDNDYVQQAINLFKARGAVIKDTKYILDLNLRLNLDEYIPEEEDSDEESDEDLK